MPLKRIPLDKTPKPCEMCGDEFAPKRRNQRFCGTICSRVYARKKLEEKRFPVDGTLRIKSNGHLLIVIDGKKVSLHRYIYEQSRKVKLSAHHHVQFRDNNPMNVMPENLYLSDNLEECIRKLHRLPKVNEVYCSNCAAIYKAVIKDYLNSGQRKKQCPSCTPINESELSGTDPSNGEVGLVKSGYISV